jgi:decaprenylphospho-beta-D-ribofuranose 2-oxidase
MCPQSSEQVLDAVGESVGAGAIARGAGRSYGDAAQNGGGMVLDMTALRDETRLDVLAHEARVAAGTTFAELLLELAHSGLTLPVVPGTRHLTVGGAIAADVHGKNHVADGSFARHLRSFELCTPARGLVEVSRESDGELFDATIGGMGLTGVIIAATLRVAPMSTHYSQAEVVRVDSLDRALEVMSEPSDYSHSIAWLDLLAGGGGFARAVVTRSKEAAGGSVSTPMLSALKQDLATRIAGRGGPSGSEAAPFAQGPLIGVPRRFPAGLLNVGTVRAFNTLHWRSTPRRARERLLTMSAQLFPLDTVGNWNRLYGEHGLVQYQFAVPSGSETLIHRIPELLRRRGLPMYLAVLKRFGACTEGKLSFPLEGWTMAIDLPAATPGLEQGLAEADEILASSGGRVYLAKDARMRPETMAAMYPALGEFRDVCERVDPERRLQSDMARRLELR